MVNKTHIDPGFDPLCCNSSGGRHTLRFPQSHPFFFSPASIVSTTGGKRRFRLSRLSPDSGLYKSTDMSAECTLKDVKYSPLLCCSPFFLFNLTISLSLSPDCIRIDCNLSKCLLCSIYCSMIMNTYTVHCGTAITCRLLRFFGFLRRKHKRVQLSWPAVLLVYCLLAPGWDGGCVFPACSNWIFFMQTTFLQHFKWHVLLIIATQQCPN